MSEPERMVVHRFDTTAHAYDACQCDESLQDGDVLFVYSEGVVGFVDTWPTAITVEHADLHALAPEGNAERLRQDLHVPLATLRMAIALADGYHFPVDPRWRALANDTPPPPTCRTCGLAPAVNGEQCQDCMNEQRYTHVPVVSAEFPWTCRHGHRFRACPEGSVCPVCNGTRTVDDADER